MRSRLKRALQGRDTVWIPAALALCTIAASIWYLYCERKIAGRWGFSLDDSWIYAPFARNIATGQGYSFNPGERIAGATGPLYTLVLAMLYAIFRDVVIPAKILGIACLAATGVLTYLAARTLYPERRLPALLAGALVAVSPLLLWSAVSGMEIPLYLLVASLGLYDYARERWTRAALWWALGVWIRPDGILLALMGIFLRPAAARRGIRSALLAAAPILGAYVAFNYFVGHHPLPNSVLMKSHVGQDPLGYLRPMLRQWASVWGLRMRAPDLAPHAVVLLPCIIAGGLLLARRVPAVVGYAFCLPVALALAGASSGAHARYLMPTIPFAIVLGVAGMSRMSGRLFPRRPRALLLAIGAAALVWQSGSVIHMGRLHGQNVENINDMQRYLAEAIRLNTSPGDTIATNDVGAIGTFSGCYVVDLMGLVSPRGTFPEIISRYRPKYVLIFPEWFPSYIDKEPNTGRMVFHDEADTAFKYVPVAGAGLRRNTICARDEMLVFARLRPGQEGPARFQMVWH